MKSLYALVHKETGEYLAYSHYTAFTQFEEDEPVEFEFEENQNGMPWVTTDLGLAKSVLTESYTSSGTNKGRPKKSTGGMSPGDYLQYEVVALVPFPVI